MLEFDCGGTVVENMPGKIHMTGGEIKSSAAGTFVQRDTWLEIFSALTSQRIRGRREPTIPEI